MNQILQWLSEGDLRSDGLANEVVKVVIQQPDLIGDLIEGLDHPEDTIRGHAADALEKIGRSHPDLLEDFVPKLLTSLQTDPVTIVKMHLAMICGHLSMYEEHSSDFISVLLNLSGDESVYAVSWSIVSLCIFGRKYPHARERILQEIVALRGREKAAIRSRVNKAILLLTDENVPFPAGWIKSERIGL